ncbi:MAG: hypothetical protein NWF00_11770 [Candidatus Bathyarchaeota archaeon]|nr:hypothetical protein [Candidatus Bathyarchaeota archaeon]
MSKHKIAVATNGKEGLDDVVSNVFGKAKTFTVIEVDGEQIISVNVIDNPALVYSHGAGPIAIKTLIDDGVDLVIASELGIGASDILHQHNVTYIQAEPDTNVGETVKKTLAKIQKQPVAEKQGN